MLCKCVKTDAATLLNIPRTRKYVSNLDGQWESASPARNLFLKIIDLLDFTAGDFSLEVLELVSFFGQAALDVLADVDAGVDVACNTSEVFFTHASR